MPSLPALSGRRVAQIFVVLGWHVARSARKSHNFGQAEAHGNAFRARSDDQPLHLLLTPKEAERTSLLMKHLGQRYVQ